MDLVLDIFNSDAFSVTELSKSIDLVPIKWGRLGELNLFPEQGIPTTSVIVEFRNNQLTILPTRPRGAPRHARRDRPPLRQDLLDPAHPAR